MLFIVLGIILLIWGQQGAMWKMCIIWRELHTKCRAQWQESCQPKTSLLHMLIKRIHRFGKLKKRLFKA